MSHRKDGDLHSTQPAAGNSRQLRAQQLSETDLLSLDYEGKLSLLEAVTSELLSLRVEFAQVSGKFAELRANIQVLKEVKSALQSAIRAEAQ